MFKSKFSKLCTLLLVFGMLFSICSVSYAETPVRGDPNSTLEMHNKNGSVRRRREFGEDGQAKKDIDYNHGGKGHEFPHVHDWKWKDGKPKRDDPRKPKEGELEDAEKKAKDTAKKVTIGAALGTILYFTISEGSRIIFPPRNLIPIL